MRLHSRHGVVSQASRDISEGLDRVIKFYNSLGSYVDLLYHLGEIKLTLLKEMGSSVVQALPYAGIPEERRALSLVLYQAKAGYGLTDAELYQIITEREFRESMYMLRYERHGDFDKGANEE